MRGATESRQRAIDPVEKLPTERLDEAVDFLESLCLQTNQVVSPAPSKSEERVTVPTPTRLIWQPNSASLPLRVSLY